MTTQRRLKLGFIGIGVGGLEILRAAAAMDDIEVAGAADVVPETRQRFQERFPEAHVYATAEELCADPAIEAVWVATPNRLHAEHAILAASHGKHVVVEKPMALSLEQASAMIEAANRNGVKLLAGHTRAFTTPIRAIAKIVHSGRLGPLRAMHVWSYSDWMLRPRTRDELDPEQGGGVPYRQAPHQVDTIRSIGGGLVRSVRGTTGKWLEARPIPGYYTAYLEFEDGTPATVMHNGYGYFLGAELVPWGEPRQRYTVDERIRVRSELRAGTRREDEEKQDMRIGGVEEQRRTPGAAPRPWVPEDMGMLIVSCERGDLRQSKHGIYIYDDNGIRDLEMPTGGADRRSELTELYDAVVNSRPVFHDGRWGMATLEVGLAIMQSAKERKEIYLSHQVPVPAGYNDDLDVDF